MATAFERLKARRGDAERLRLFAMADVLFGKDLERKVDAALRSIGKHKLANKIRDCGRGAVCSSLYCRKCRNSAASRMQQRLWDRYQKSLDGKATWANQDPADKIRHIASYPFKNRLRYNPSFATRGWETGAFFTNRDAGKLIHLYQRFMESGAGTGRSFLINVG